MINQRDVVIRLRCAFPHALATQVDRAIAIIPTADQSLSPDCIGPVSMEGERLNIPYRIYSPEPGAESIGALGDTPRLILSCLYTRHDDGVVREKYLSPLLASTSVWVPPFVIQLVAEYVVEIIELIVSQLNSVDSDLYSQFAGQNPEFLNLARQRIVSYWQCYYRDRFPQFRDYPGFQLMDSLGLWRSRAAARLLAG